MHSSLLCPPNSHLLTDNVIGAVVTRRTRPQLYEEKANTIVFAHEATSSYPTEPRTEPAIDQTVDKLWNSRSTKEKALQMQRQRRRKTQRRYRQRMEDQASSLAEEITRLKAEVQYFKLKLSHPCVAIDITPWRAAVELCRVFRNGFEGPTTKLPVPEDHTQKRLLLATMTQNVACNDGYGVDAVLEGWRVRAQYQEKIEVTLKRLEQGPDNLLIAYLNIAEVLTRKSLGCFDGFASKLFGVELEVPTRVYFRWDDEQSRFSSIHFEADMLAPLIKLLGNVEDASTVLSSFIGIRRPN